MEILFIILYNLALSFIGYIFGSISFSIVMVKLLKLQDIRKIGSGNAGATNMTRTHGKKFGVLVFLGDFSKLIAAVAVAWILTKYVNEFKGEYIFIQLTGIFVIIGHIFPIFHKFKGGKGASSFAGYLTAFMWPSFLIGVVSWLIIFKKSRMVSLATLLGSLIVVLSFGTILFLIDFFDLEKYTNWMFMFNTNYAWWINIVFVSTAFIILTLKHKANIVRIIKGTENKFINKRKQEEKTALINLQTKEINYLDPTVEFTPKTTTIEITEVEMPSTDTINVSKKEQEAEERLKELKKLVDDKRRLEEIKEENKENNN